MKGDVSIDGVDFGECDFDIKFNSIAIPKKSRIPTNVNGSFSMKVITMDKSLLAEFSKTKPCPKCGEIPDFYLKSLGQNELHCNKCLRKKK